MILFETISAERARNMNPVVLAFIGDAVYSLCTRKALALGSDSKAGQLHKTAAKSVSAACQSEFLGLIIPHLTQDETDIFKRARNAKKGTKAKNSTAADYNRSTGFEALVGYLYITGEYERLGFLLSIGEKSES